MHQLTRIVLCLVLITPIVASAAEKNETIQQEKMSKNANLKYLLYLPENYEESKESFPLMLFLHGAGERGDNLARVKRHGPPKLVEKGKKFPFIVISPQCPQRSWWNSDSLSKLLDEVVKQYRVDQNRIYVTGLSMGGYGTWALAAKYPDRFAAIAPICGGGNTKSAEKLKSIPIWVFHGAKDSVVKVRLSEVMVEAIKKAGSKNIKFTVYPNANHDSWTKTYDNPELYKWFLKHNLEGE